ncbi:MAG TPA: MBOAT family O-acyltransferase [Azospirillaceae bacterium]|nr:MBOAT family O-acyltransferase [Azospirillaceae bacterium]
MTFVSLEMLAWMAGTVALFRLAPNGLRHPVLAGITLAFLVVHAPGSVLPLVLFTVATYGLPRLGRGSTAALLVAGALVGGVLLAFKAGLAAPAGGSARLVMPLGLSYYALRCLHYLIESYKGRLPPHGFGEFAGYLFFLPTLVAGPIHRFPDYLRDRRDPRRGAAALSRGLERILYGYVHIVVFGNWLVSLKLRGLVDSLGPERARLAEYLDCLRFGANVYFQFAGYSSIAIGFALLLGFRVIENFNWPFLARNIADFWRRWHISLSSWCRDYVYMPVVALTRDVSLAALASMLVLALWHELSPRYVAWGLYHGLGVVAWQGFQKARRRLPPVRSEAGRAVALALSVAVTANFVILSFAITKEPSLREAVRVYVLILFGVKPDVFLP